MLRRSFRIGLLVGLVGGIIAAVVKAVQGRTSSEPAPAPAAWTPLPDAQPVVVPAPPPPAPPAPKPAPPKLSPTAPKVSIADLQEGPAPDKADVAPKSPAKKAPAKKKAPAAKAAPWVEPDGGVCPPSHPVKGKLTSKIFHLPGGFNYARTAPDRCYRDAAAAESDGLRQAKR